MKVQLGFICLVVKDIARSLTFYRHLGFEFPPEAYGEPYVEAELPGGLQIMWNRADDVQIYAPDYRPSAHGKVLLAFELGSPDEVDALFKKLKSLGYRGDRTPWDMPWGHRYAIVYDPDGNMIDLYSPHT